MRTWVAGAMLVASATAASAQGVAVSIDADGLRLVDTSSGNTVPLPFNTPQADTLSRLTSLGAPHTGTNSQCQGGAVDYATFPDGLTVRFRNKQFVGWTVTPAGQNSVTDMAGIGPGSTRAQFSKVHSTPVTQGPDGWGFSEGQMGGLFDGGAQTSKITKIWSGVHCDAH